MWESQAQHEKNARKRVSFLITKGFTPLSDSRFMKNGKVYDLSAADLGQIERIEREGRFVIKLEALQA